MLSRLELLLVSLMEECSEVQKRASKALRFGLHEIRPGRDKNNLQLIAEEMVDLISIFNMLDAETNKELEKELMILEYEDAYEAKERKVEKYIKYSIEKGCVSPEAAIIEEGENK